MSWYLVLRQLQLPNFDTIQISKKRVHKNSEQPKKKRKNFIGLLSVVFSVFDYDFDALSGFGRILQIL